MRRLKFYGKGRDFLRAAAVMTLSQFFLFYIDAEKNSIKQSSGLHDRVGVASVGEGAWFWPVPPNPKTRTPPLPPCAGDCGRGITTG
jgi:hypothetical protein